MLTLALLLHIVGFRGAVCLNGNPTVSEEFKQREGVVAATVLSEPYQPPVGRYFTEEGTTYTARIDEVFKGRIAKTLQIFSENSSGRFPMDVGTKYLLFLYRVEGRTLVDNCGNSEPFSPESKVLRAVRAIGGCPLNKSDGRRSPYLGSHRASRRPPPGAPAAHANRCSGSG